jgi:hypothetical protein
MKKELGRVLAGIGLSAVLAGALPAAAAPQAGSIALDGSSVLSKLDVSGSGVFAAIPGASDIQAPAAIAGAAIADKASQLAASRTTRVSPDWSFTPGKLCTASDPGFSTYRYPEHVPYCLRNVTEQMKQEVAAHYGVPQSDWSSYEFDHLIPLCIGGDSHVDNLWPQPHEGGSSDPNGSYGKDKLEDQLYKQMSAGSITQANAIKQIQAWFDGTSEVDNGMSAESTSDEPHQD